MSKRSKFNEEFKRGAVVQASCAQVARELGILDSLLTRWKHDAQTQGHTAFAGTGTPRDQELARLKRELARVKKERDFLRKAAAFLAKGVAADRKLTQWGAAEILDFLEVVHVFIRRPHPSGQALHQTGEAHRGNYSSVGLPDEEFSEGLA
jgi:transposase